MAFDVNELERVNTASPRASGADVLGLQDRHTGLDPVPDADGSRLAVEFYKASVMSPEEYKYFTEKYRPYFKDPSISDERKDQFIIALHKIFKTIIVQAKNRLIVDNLSISSGKTANHRSLPDSGHGSFLSITKMNRDPLLDKE